MRNLKLDNSCTSNSKLEICNWTPQLAGPIAISDFEFEVQELSNFQISFRSDIRKRQWTGDCAVDIRKAVFLREGS